MKAEAVEVFYATYLMNSNTKNRTWVFIAVTNLNFLVFFVVAVPELTS